MQAGFQQLLTKASGPHWRTSNALIAGFFTGILCGYLDPNWEVDLSSALTVGTLILGNDALIRGVMARRHTLFQDAGVVLSATEAGKLFMIRYVQGSAFMSLGFVSGFVIGYPLGAEIRSIFP
jgi:hypothetical protein